MDDDFNTSKALGEIFAFIGKVNSQSDLSLEAKRSAKSCVEELISVFGIELEKKVEYPAELVGLANNLANYAGDNLEEAAEAILVARADARKNKD